MSETREERVARFTKTMRAAGSTLEGTDAPAPPPPAPDPPKPDVPAPAEPPKPPDTAAPPATEPTPEAVAAAASTLSRWKRKIKALDEEKELDLESMPDAELDTLLGQGLAYPTMKERLRSRAEEAKESVETEKTRAVEKTVKWLQEHAKAQGIQIHIDPNTQKIVFSHEAPQTAGNAAQPPGQAIDLDALERNFLDRNDAESAALYMRGLRQSVGRPLTEGQIAAMVEQRLEQGRRELAEKETIGGRLQAVKGNVDRVFADRKADFDSMGPLAEQYRQMARRSAASLSRDLDAAVIAKDTAKIDQIGAQVCKIIHETADIAKRSVQTAHGANGNGTPRPKAPTVIPSGGAPAPAPANPAAFDLKTPEGRKKAVEHLERARSASKTPAIV